MILTDREISSALANEQITIEPRPNEKAFSSSSVDLTLDGPIRIWKTIATGVDITVCPADPNYSYETVAKEYTTSAVIAEDGYLLKPNAFLLAWTIESVELPCHSRLCARVEGKSSLARLGISIHQTAPLIHAGFKGPIQLEICHHGILPVKLRRSMPVCQLILEQTLGTPEKGYRGQFYAQQPA